MYTHSRITWIESTRTSNHYRTSNRIRLIVLCLNKSKQTQQAQNIIDTNPKQRKIGCVFFLRVRARSCSPFIFGCSQYLAAISIPNKHQNHQPKINSSECNVLSVRTRFDWCFIIMFLSHIGVWWVWSTQRVSESACVCECVCACVPCVCVYCTVHGIHYGVSCSHAHHQQRKQTFRQSKFAWPIVSSVQYPSTKNGHI